MGKGRRHKVDRTRKDAPTCAKKRRFRDHKQAIQSLHRIIGGGEKRRGSIPQRVYYCQTCNGFHLTSSAGRTTP
jgi:hypothetical protein